MSGLIDWHAHHVPSEAIARCAEAGLRPPKIEREDSDNFARRVADMDAAGVEVQLVCAGAGLNADRLPAERALGIARAVNDAIAERIAPYPDRLFGMAMVGYGDVPGAVAELDRLAARGFRAALLFARPTVVGSADLEPLWAKIAALGWPIFLHGGGSYPSDPVLAQLEDGGQGVASSALADAAVSEFAVRMIAAGLFDRYPGLQVVLRSGGGSIALLVNKLYWKHKGPAGEQQYRDVLRQHFLVDTANVDTRTVRFLVDMMGEERVVFGSDYCGGPGPIARALPPIDDQPEPARLRAALDRNSRRLLKL